MFGITVEVGKEILHIADAQRKHPRLVAVIARSKIALLEVSSQDDLRHFLALTGDGKVCLARQHFTTREDTALSRDYTYPEVAYDLVFISIFCLVFGI